MGRVDSKAYNVTVASVSFVLLPGDNSRKRGILIGVGNIKKRPLPCKLSDNFGEWLEFDIDTSTGARDQPGKPRVLVRVRVGLGTGVRVDQWDAD